MYILYMLRAYQPITISFGNYLQTTLGLHYQVKEAVAKAIILTNQVKGNSGVTCMSFHSSFVTS